MQLVFVSAGMEPGGMIVELKRVALEIPTTLEEAQLRARTHRLSPL